MKIVFAASEMTPFVKTGGLADVIGTLPQEIERLGHKVLVFIPRTKGVDPQKRELQVAIDRLDVPLGTEKETGRIYRTVLKSGAEVYLVDHPEFFCREGLYGTGLGDYPDNDRRFIFFQRAVLETLRATGFNPDVIHCHDWQTGLIPTYLKTLYARDPVFEKTKSVFTIHNLAYQGNFPPDSLPATGLDWNQFRLERLEFYGKVSFLKAGLVDADLVTTVSERYAQEIQTKEFGCGMEGVFAKRRDVLFGIINGIDPAEWDPETDSDLTARYSVEKIDRKGINKNALQKEDGLTADPKIPLLGLVARLVEHKGLDILMAGLPLMMEWGVQFVLLGTGDEKYHQLLREAAKKYKGKMAVHILFDPKKAKQIYAGCDLMLLPSYYEPCGLGQMIALRFGTVPVARRTGGLADTVREFNPKTGRGNGFCFDDYKPEALAAAVRRALALYRDPDKWSGLVKNAMACDFSWTASAKKYVRVYEKVKNA